MSQSMKPRKVCVIGDTCIVCGFSFVKYEKNANGKEIVHKFYESKMRLNAERIDYIKKVTEKSEELELELEGCNAGLCRKCLRTIESVFKSEEKNKATKQKIRESFDKVYKTDTVLLPAPRPKHILRVSNTSPVNCDSQLAKFRKIAPQPEVFTHSFSKVEEHNSFLFVFLFIWNFHPQILHEIDAKLKEEETGMCMSILCHRDNSERLCMHACTCQCRAGAIAFARQNLCCR